MSQLLSLLPWPIAVWQKFDARRWESSTETWISRDDFAIVVPQCIATVAVCEIHFNNSAKGLTHHFAHSSQKVLPCWAFFGWYPSLEPVILLEHGRLVSHSRWMRGLLALMDVRVTTRRSYACSIRGILTNLSSGWNEEQPVRWVSAPEDTSRLMRRLFQLHPGRYINTSALRIGLLLRRRSRRLLYEAQIIARIRHDYPMATIRATAMDALSFIEQAAFVYAQNIIVSPHGAQNMNFIFARPCASVLEVFPKDYYIPAFYLPAARAAGAYAYSASADRRNSPMTTTSYAFQARARRATVDITPDEVMAAIELMRNANIACPGHAAKVRGL